ncbi:hypothetical protein [Ruicaihuangia caeni]|uniref:hypothetical protein n=1 Tax=Ruicaihuangia caeni TaxID=3042517 RepID=UPI00338D9A3D
MNRDAQEQAGEPSAAEAQAVADADVAVSAEDSGPDDVATDLAGAPAAVNEEALESLLASLRERLREIASRLAEAGARDEALAEYVPPRRVAKVIPRDAVFRPLGRVWRLGVFLLDREGRLYAAGTSTRAVRPGHPGYQSVSAEQRRAFRAAASRSRFEDGETINFDAREIVLTPEGLGALIDGPGPLVVHHGGLRVRWTPEAQILVRFDEYLEERVHLLTGPAGA